jgi:hypothetical protein
MSVSYGYYLFLFICTLSTSDYGTLTGKQERIWKESKISLVMCKSANCVEEMKNMLRNL